MEDCAKVLPIEESNHDDLVKFAKEEQIGLVIIGPEAPLLDGLADRFAESGITVFGPKDAAQIEGSKSLLNI